MLWNFGTCWWRPQTVLMSFFDRAYGTNFQKPIAPVAHIRRRRLK
jgi:hypothetical protein